MQKPISLSGSQQIGECEWCGEPYCMRCSDSIYPERFCSKICENAATTEGLWPDIDDDEAS